jgi:hypothetical protein
MEFTGDISNDNEEAGIVLPTGATQNEDGSITLQLEAAQASMGGDRLRLHRLTGEDLRRVARSRSDKATMLMACATRLPFPGWVQLASSLSSDDLGKARSLVGDLAGFGSAQNRRCSAPDETGAVTVQLLRPLQAHDGQLIRSLLLHRPKGEDIRVADKSRDVVPALFARSMRMPPRIADTLYDAMDAIDVAAVRSVLLPAVPAC